MKTPVILSLLGILLLGSLHPLPAQNIRREYWLNLNGGTIADLTSSPDYPTNPSGVDFPTLLEGPSQWADFYGSRLRGYVYPPVTGDYIFYMSSDDQGALYLSSDEYPANKQLIASEPQWNGSRDWFGTNRRPNQENTSAPVRLEAGQRYYIEVLQKEGGGGDNVAVAWQIPGGAFEGPIPSNRISPFLISNDPPEIIQQPTNLSVSEGSRAEFRVVANGAEPLSFRWQRDGQDMIGQVFPNVIIDPVNLDDDGALLQCFITNPLGSTNTVVVTLTVTPEAIPPTVTAVTPPAGTIVRQLTQVAVHFSESVTGVDAGDLMINGVSATSLTGSGSGPYVFHFTQPTSGTVTVAWRNNHGITDLSQAVNAFAGGSWQLTLDPAAQLPDVVINEFLTSNLSGLADEDGEIGDWIELHNRGATSAHLSGWSLTDDERYPGQWQLPDITLPPGGYLVIFADGKDRHVAGPPLHTNFQLSRAGEFLALYNHEFPRTQIDALPPAYPEQRGDHSYGRDTANAWRYFVNPTPGFANGDSTIVGLTSAPHFSAGRGFYDEPFNLHLSAEPGAAIRYTVDGSEPTATTGFVYSAPIPINSTTTLRAVAFKANQLPSVAITHTFLMNVGSAISSLPVLSIVTANNNLWGETGIMETNPRNTSNRGIAWERPASAEWIRPEDNGGFALDAGLRVQGGGYIRDRYDPLSTPPFSKYSFRLYFRGDYGSSQLKYPIFPDVPFDEFEKLSLRAGMNDHSNPFIVDELVRRLYGDTGNVSSHGTVANLFLNGQYKGYYNPAERIDADFLHSWFGGTNDWDLLAQFGEVREGDNVKWNEMVSFISGNDMANPSSYAYAGSLLDLDNFIDYLVVNVYAGTGDWPHNNWRAARERIPGAKFKMIIWDAEWAFGNAGRDVNVNNLAGELSASSEIARMFQSLRANPEFRLRFADRVHRHLFNDGALIDSKILARYWELRNEMAGVLPNMNSYIHTTFVPGRRAVIFNQLKSFGLYASDHAPVFNQHGGRIPDGFNLSMTSPRGTIYYTFDGTDPRLPAEGSALEETLVRRDNAKRGLVPSAINSGSTLGDAWKGGAEPFNDGAWLSGTNGIGYDTSIEYDAHIDPGMDVELAMFNVNGSAFLRIPFNVSAGINLADYNSLSLTVQFDDGFVAYLNGVEVASANAPPAPAWNSQATAGNPDSSAVNFQAFDISDHLNLLKPGANLLAIHGLNAGLTSSDFLCNAELTMRRLVPGEVSSTALVYGSPIPLNQPVTVKARSLDAGEWSAMTEATFEPNVLGVPVRITEIMYNPVGGDAYEFIELHNYGFAPINLSGFSFEGINFLFPNGSTIPGGGTLVLASDLSPSQFAARYPGIAVAGHFGGTLSNDGERIALLDAAGNVVTAVTYSDGGTWPQSADGGGYSLVLANALGDPNQSSSWRASADLDGDPGALSPASPVPSIRLNELMADNTNSVPHEGTYPDWIELHNAGGSPVDLAGWSLTDDGEPRKFVFPASTSLPAGGYLVVWCDTAATSGLHTGFGLGIGGETIQLYDAGTNLIDTVSFGVQLSDFSLGRVAGTADPWQLNQPTPGAANNAASLAPQSSLVINEWLANPLPGQPDWFELYNSNATLPVSLQGIHVGNFTTLHVMRSRSFVAPGGFIQLFADEQAGVNHVEFKLAAIGGTIELYDSAGARVQTLTYPAQTEGVAQGRLPNASVNIQSFPASASPGASNYLLAWSGPILNEFMAENEGVVTMANGRASDWLEIRNPLTTAFNLTGMSLSFGGAQAGEWKFPDGLNIPAGGHLVVWCDKDLPATTNLVAELNTGRSLSSRGDRVYLFSAQNQLADSLSFGPQVANLSVGRVGAAWQLKTSPTPGSANSANITTGAIGSVRINEWQTSPSKGADWLELYNSALAPVVLDASALTDDPSIAGRTKFRFGVNSFIPANGWLKLIADGNPDKGGDHVNFNLADGGEHLILRRSDLGLVDAVDFDAQAPDTSRGRFPDGISTWVTFTTTVSPGDSNYLPLGNVVVNEVLSHTDPPLKDSIELYNPTSTPVNIGGWFLSDSSSNLKKFQVPAGTTIPAFGYWTFDESHFNGGAGTLTPFTLNSARGDSVYVSEADAFGYLSGLRTQVTFGPSANGVSFGRYQTSVGVDFVPQSQRTLNAANAYPMIGDVVLSEIMADAVGVPSLNSADGEYVELQNRTGGDLALYDVLHPENTWRLSGAVEFDFPQGALIPANGRVLVVSFNPATNPDKLTAFADHYGVPVGTLVYGPYSGRLSSAGETLTLERPDNPQTSGPDIGLVPYLEVEHVTWSNQSPWPTNNIGFGASLQRLALAEYANDPVNWSTGVPSSGTLNSVNPLDTDNDGMPDWFEISYGLNPGSAADANLDADGDGISNVNEFRSRTSPRDASSALAINVVDRVGTSAIVGFRAQAGVHYELEYLDAIGSGTWQKLTDIPSLYYQRDEVVSDFQAVGEERYYRLRIP